MLVASGTIGTVVDEATLASTPDVIVVDAVVDVSAGVVLITVWSARVEPLEAAQINVVRVIRVRSAMTRFWWGDRRHQRRR